ncbi:uncharacterized protein LOC129236175 [Anastrepha obliqua]|uniref:uncharacterized protein LOC129236175 n=1 Tax=Anastrepha obliqua TaxID=95512 RepID=UPI00240A515B|nr:uncharacterized protein LOC129236175 [Anastrepha obliqua]
MQCLESDINDTQFNLLANEVAKECRRVVATKQPAQPCDRPNRKPLTLDTFCNHNVNIQYKYGDSKDETPKGCGICVKMDKKGGKETPCQLCKKKEMTRDEKLAEAIKCISSPLPSYFNEKKRCDPMSVCCRMLGGVKKCPSKDNLYSCTEPEPTTQINKFAINYPPNKLTVRVELHNNPKCKANFRCQGTVDEGDCHKFKPNYRELPLTEKFYSKYEHLESCDTPDVRHYENELDKITNYFARDIFCVPRYTNQYYGWLDSKNIQHLEFCDASRVCAPKVLHNLKTLESRRFDPIQLQYCLCHDMIKQMDHWKIV